MKSECCVAVKVLLSDNKQSFTVNFHYAAQSIRVEISQIREFMKTIGETLKEPKDYKDKKTLRAPTDEGKKRTAQSIGMVKQL